MKGVCVCVLCVCGLQHTLLTSIHPCRPPMSLKRLLRSSYDCRHGKIGSPADPTNPPFGHDASWCVPERLEIDMSGQVRDRSHGGRGAGAGGGKVFILTADMSVPRVFPDPWMWGSAAGEAEAKEREGEEGNLRGTLMNQVMDGTNVSDPEKKMICRNRTPSHLLFSSLVTPERPAPRDSLLHGSTFFMRRRRLTLRLH